MAKRTWLDEHLDVFLDELAGFDLNVPRARAAELLRDRVSAVAEAMRIGERSARAYVNEEMIRDLARTLAFSVADEHPGADLSDLPHDASIPTTTLGRLFASLAEAGFVRLVNADPGGARSAFQLISTYGQLMHAAGPSGGAQVPYPSAALARGARFLEATADLLRNGASLVEGVDPAAADAVAGHMAIDAETLRRLIPDAR